MEDYQIFISYRREGGEDLTGRVSDKLKGLGYHVFYDIESMRSGAFNEQIFSAIDQCEDVLVILPPNGLDRCLEENDWVRLEIAHAIQSKKNIIPVMMRNFAFPESLPADIDALRYFEGVSASTEYFDAMIGKIEKLLVSKRLSADERPKDTNADFAAGVRFLNYKLYDQAQAAFQKALQTDISNPELYFYAAVALLGGKRPFLVNKSVIRQIEEYLQATIAIGNQAIAHYLLAYVKYDFYRNKMLRTTPEYEQALAVAHHLEITEEEIRMLFELLNQQKPACF